MGTLLHRCVEVRTAIELSFGVVSGVGQSIHVLDGSPHGKGLFLAWYLAFFGIWACIGFNRRNDAEKCIRLVCEKLTVFPYAR